MLPAPLFAADTVTDVAATSAIVQGLNDNLVQTTDSQGNIDRKAAFFTGVDQSLHVQFTTPTTDVHGLRLRVRGQFYEPLETTSADPDGSFQGAWSSTVAAGRFTTLGLSLSSSVTSVTSARVGDGQIFYLLDPAATQTTFSLNQASGFITQEVTPRWRYRHSAGALVTTTIQAPPLPLAGGILLDRRGFDGFQPFTTGSLIHDISWRDTGDVTLAYRYLYSPYSLDFTSSPPRAGGPQRIHQVLPDVGWAHAWNEHLRTITRAGISVSNPPTFDPQQGALVRPVATEEVHFGNERWTFLGAGSLTYGTVTPRLGAGPQAGVNGALAGVPYSYGKWGKMVMIARGVASYATINAGPGSTATLTILGVGAEARYPLTRHLGVIGGYDVRLSTFTTTNSPVNSFFRNILFIGISGYWTTDGNIPPLQLIEAPFRPG